ncbi:MAG: ATP synthase F1 subunit epsilon [Gemmataceae bacterium]
MATIRCVVVTPETSVLDETVDFVAIPMFDGELGVAPGRTPLIGRVGYGELRTRTGDSVNRYYIDGGFVEIRDNVVTVLTQRALFGTDISADVIANAEAEATQPATTDETIEERLGKQARLRAIQKIASRSKG